MGHLSVGFVGEEPAQSFILHAADVELAKGDGGEQGLVAGIEQVGAGIGTTVVLDSRPLRGSPIADKNPR